MVTAAPDMDRAGQGGGRVPCPSGEHLIRSDSTSCEACNARVATQCGRCRRDLRAGARFCDSCGEPVAPGSAPASAPALPASFGDARYQVKRFLGEGGRKRVYLANDTRLERDVAVAVVKTDRLDEAGLARIRREARVMARLGDHANVVTIYDVGDDNGGTYIVSQFVAGGSVADLIRGSDHGRLPLDQALRIANDVCCALEYAHARGVVHRDVKPSNIWLTQDGTAKLGDFGLAHAVDRSRLTIEGMMVGTVAYMSPEQALGRAPDVRSDLYSLGATVYEMVTGRPPFLGDDVVAVISQHINTPPVAPSWHNQQIPRALEALVMRLLSKAPEDRPDTAAAVRQALAAITPTAASAPATSAIEVNPLDRLAGGVFVGRERELDELRAALEQALSGRGRLVLLMGEAGIGKTRTAEELVTFARLRKVQVLWGRCYEGDAAPAYWPWIQAIRSYIQDRDAKTLLAEMGSGASDLAQLFSEVRDRLPGLPVPPALEPEQARFRRFDGVTTFLRNAGRTQPLMVVLDDLHWADRSSLLLLLFVARELRDARLIILGTYRDSEVDRQHPLSQALGELTRGELAQRITLRGLGESDVARFIEITAGIKPPAGLVQALYRETEGNPFFVNEIVRLLVSEGRLEKTPHGRSWSLDIPESVRDVIGRRLDRLSSDCNRILSIASVVGREFGLPVLQPLSGLDEERLLDLLDEALRARVVVEMPATIGRFAFSHALVRETLASEITPARRARLHRRIGEVLEGLQQGSHEADVAEIAHHFFEAARAGGDVEKAVGYSVRAGERATALVAYDEAVTHYAQALQVLDCARPADEARRCSLLLSLGEAHDRAGNSPLAKEAFLAAADLARKLGATDLLARAAFAFCGRWLGLVEVGKVDLQLIGLLEEALTALGNAESLLRARVLGRLATELYFVPGSEARRDSLSRDAVELARRLGDLATIGEALRARHVAIWGPDNVEERLAISTEMTSAAERAGNREEAIAGSFFRLADLLEFGDADQLPGESERLSAKVKDSAFAFGKWVLALHRARRALLDGRFTEAEGLAQEALSIGQGPHPETSTLAFVVQTATVLYHQGRLGEFETTLESVARQYPTITVPAWGSVLIYATGGRLEAAQREFERLTAQDFRDIPRDLFWLGTMMPVVDTCVAIGDAKRAALLYDLIRPYTHRNLVHGFGVVFWGSAARLLGNLATLLERWDEAESHFEIALQGETRLGARAWLAHTQQEYAAMLLARGRPGDRARARELLAAALEVARELGMKPVVERILALKLRAQGVVAPSPAVSLDAVVSAVQKEPPDLRVHAAPDGTVTILFTDIQDWTVLSEQLGDQRAQEVLRTHNQIVRAQVRRLGGFEVKSQGDGFMLAFQSARKGVLCAVALQREFSRFNERHTDTPLRVRMGLHTGEAIKDRDDFFGRAVILAARIAASARGEEILISSLVKDLTEAAGDIRIGSGRQVTLKGLHGVFQLYPLIWSDAAPEG